VVQVVQARSSPFVRVSRTSIRRLAGSTRRNGAWVPSRTMGTFKNTVTIRRSVEDVFSFLADLENVPKWNYAIVETRKVSAGPVGVGTIYQQVRSVPSRSEEHLEVTAYTLPSSWRYEVSLGRSRPGSPMPSTPSQRAPAKLLLLSSFDSGSRSSVERLGTSQV
jgi:hypothetical protein